MANEEKVYFRNDAVLVSDKRFVAHGTTYALQNIASVSAGVDSPGKIGGILILVIGVSSIFANPFFGVPITAIALWYLYKRRPAHVVVLRDASGETNALRSYDQTEIGQIVTALNQAIVERA